MLLTNPYYPDPRPEKEINVLLKNGYEVEIVAWDREGNIKLPEREESDNLIINRLITKNSGYGKGYSSILNFIKYYLKTIKFVKKKKFDIIYAHDIDTLIPAFVLKLITHSKLVLDMHEYYEGMFFKNSRTFKGIFVFIIQIIKAIIFPFVNLFVLVNAVLLEKDKVLNKYKDRCIVIQNFPDDLWISDVKPNVGENVNICFFGAVREFEIIKTVADVVEKRNDAALHVAGNGVDASKVQSYLKNKKNLTYYGTFGPKDLPELYSGMDLVLCLYTIDESNRFAIPVKYFEAYEIGIPVVCYKGTALADIISEDDIGFVLDGKNELQDFFSKIDTEDIKIKKNNIMKKQKVQRFNFSSQSYILLDSINTL